MAGQRVSGSSADALREKMAHAPAVPLPGEELQQGFLRSCTGFLLYDETLDMEVNQDTVGTLAKARSGGILRRGQQSSRLF